MASLKSRVTGSSTASWLGGLIVIAAALRLLQLGSHSLWFDEAISAIAARYDLVTIATQNLDPMAPPLYFVLMGAWVRGTTILGLPVSEAALRLPSAVFSVMALIPVYAVARKMFNSKVGLFAVLFMTVLPVQVSYAQEARAYGLVIFWSSMILWLFLRAAEGDRRRDWWWLALACLLGIYIHYLIALLVAALQVYALSISDRRRLLSQMVRVDAVLLIGLLPLASSVLYQATQLSAAFKLDRPSVLAPLLTITFWLFGYIRTAWFVPFALFIGLALVATLTASARWQPVVERNYIKLLLSTIFVPMLIMVGLSYAVRPIYFDRYFAFASPALVIFLAQGIERKPKWLIRLLLSGLLILSVIKLGEQYTQPDPARPPFRDASDYIATHAQPGDVVFHLHDSTFPSFRYYAPEMTTYLWKDDSAGWLVPSAWKWFGERTTDLSALFDGHPRIWVMSLPDTLDESRRDLEAEIEARYSKVGKVHFQNIMVDLYAEADQK